MATYVPAKKNTAWIGYIGLVSQADTKLLKSNPTIAAGDFKVSIDGGALANLATLPTVTPASSVMVKISLSNTEMNGDNITVVCIDAAGAEWCDQLINIQTAARQIDDLAYPATSGRSMVVDAAGLVDANAVKVGPTGSGTAQTAGDIIGETNDIQTTVASIQTDTNDIQTRLPAALTAGGNMKVDTLYEGGAVWFDTGGAAGTTNFVHGTMTNPNSSMANSRTIANALGLKTFRINNNSSVTLDQGYNGFAFIGDKWTLALANRLVSNSYFKGADVSGTCTGSSYIFDHSTIGVVTLDPCTIIESGLAGTITLGSAGLFTFVKCYNAVAAGTDVILDFGAAVGATTVGMRDFVGGLEVRNMLAGDVLTFIGGGRLTIAASCTAGTVLIAGPVTLVNNGSGQTITDTSRWNEDQNITNVTGNVNGNVGGNVTGSVGSVVGAVGSVTGDIGGLDATAQSDVRDAVGLAAANLDTQLSGINSKTTNLPSDPADQSAVEAAITAATSPLATSAEIAALNDLSAAQVNAEVVDALATDTYAEPTGVPAATASLASKIGRLHEALRNKLDVTATKKTFYDDAGAALWEKDLSDDGSTYSESESNAP